MGTQEVIGVLISITALSSYLNYRFLKLPKYIGLTLISLILSLLLGLSHKAGFVGMDHFVENLLKGLNFDETFLNGMLGFLLFAASLHVNTMELAKHKTMVGLLATVSVILSTFLVGFATYGLTKLLGIPISLEYCLVFGALISPTDPIATLAILKNVKAPKALEMKIAGEALFNDGMSIGLFVILLGIAVGGEETWSFHESFWFFFQHAIGGLLLGFLMGWLAARFLRTIDNYEVAIILTLAVVTGGYTLALSAEVSAPICMAVAGLVVGGLLRHGNMSKETMQRLDSFWELVDGVLNAILFVLIGLEFLRLQFAMDTILAAMGSIVITIVARWISVAIPVAWMSIFRKYSRNVVMVMTWGGIRGGISIALALSVPLGPARDFIVAITYVVVVFSITVQGLTMGKLVQRFIKRDTAGSNKLPNSDKSSEDSAPQTSMKSSIVNAYHP